MKSLRIRVPASAANLGPGFDTLALALDLHNELTVEVTDADLDFEVEGASLRQAIQRTLRAAQAEGASVTEITIKPDAVLSDAAA